MEKKNNNGVVIMLMGVIIVILAVLCVLFATDTITFNKNINDSNLTNESQTKDESNANKSETVLTNEDALTIIKEVYNKFVKFDSFSAVEFCGDYESNSNGANAWYVKSRQFNSKEDAYNYYNTFVSREIIDKKILELENNHAKSEEFPSAILEKDGSLYCIAKAAGKQAVEIVDDETTYEITEITSSKISFTGSITTRDLYDRLFGPYNIEATIELVNNNWIVTENIEK